MAKAKKIPKSVTLDPHQIDLIRSVSVHNSAERHASETVLGKLPDSLTDSKAVSTFIDIAQRRLRDINLDRGYEQLAGSLDTEDAAFAEAQKRKRYKRQTASTT